MFVGFAQDKSHLLRGCYDDALLNEALAILDGDKVRGNRQIIVPIKSGSKLYEHFSRYKIEWCSQEVKDEVDRATANSKKRTINIEKIKAQYGCQITFDYEYSGLYKPMDHQKIMFNAIAYNDAAAILADPGTCKTGPYLWAIDRRISKGSIRRALVITLSQLKRNVLEEMKIQTPHRSGVILDNKIQSEKILKKGYKNPKKNVDYDVYIANYESMHSLVEIFEDDFFDMIVLDEAHRVGSHSSRQTKSIIGKFESSKFKYIITGTLHSNNLMSFYMPFRFLGSDTIPYADYYEFRRRYMYPVDKDMYIWVPSQTAEMEVRKMVGKLSVGFTKEECLDLPELIREKLYCEMTPNQEKLYKEFSSELIAQIDGMCNKCNMNGKCDRSCEETIQAKNVLVLAGKLRQLACGFYINTRITVDESGKQKNESNIITLNENSKMALLLQALSTIPENRKVIIWTTYIHSVKMIHAAISKAYGEKSVLTCYGNQDAFEIVEEFKKPEHSFVVANPTKFGVGLNIQFSNYQIFFNNSYSYIQRDQAEGRQHRQGQKDCVTVMDLVTRGTIDELVLKALISKKDLSISLSLLARVIKKGMEDISF